MRAILGAGLVGLMLTLPAVASEVSIYEHNGSVIDWVIVGDDVTAMYAEPRQGLAEAGIKPGTVLFKGAYEGDRIVGKASAFKAGCPVATYDVVGEHKGESIVLTGPAPRRAPNACAVVGYFVDSPNAKLVLKYSATHH